MPRFRAFRVFPLVTLVIAATLAFKYSKWWQKLDSRQQVLVGDDPRALDDEASEGGYFRHIVAVGDLHSDYGNALKVLQMADVVDGEGNWTGGVDLFVQTGDIIDRGLDTIKLYLWMENLRDQARRAGGDVVSHLGNHEWMNLLADWRYVYPKEIVTFGSVAARQKMLQTGRIGRAWAANYSVTSRIPLHPPMGLLSPFPSSTAAPQYDPPAGLSSVDFDRQRAKNDPLASAALSFVHGGLAPVYADLVPYPSAINDLSRTLLARLQKRKMPDPHPPAPYAGMPPDSTPAEHHLYGADGPLWYRGWAMKPEKEVCAEVDTVLAKTGVRRLIMGHTPNFDHMQSRCDGKIIVIDTGISHAYGGVLSALSIKYSLTPVKGSTGVWKEREIVTALYPNDHTVLAVEEREIQAGVAHLP